MLSVVYECPACQNRVEVLSSESSEGESIYSLVCNKCQELVPYNEILDCNFYLCCKYPKTNIMLIVDSDELRVGSVPLKNYLKDNHPKK